MDNLSTFEILISLVLSVLTFSINVMYLVSKIPGVRKNKKSYVPDLYRPAFTILMTISSCASVLAVCTFGISLYLYTYMDIMALISVLVFAVAKGITIACSCMYLYFRVFKRTQDVPSLI